MSRPRNAPTPTPRPQRPASPVTPATVTPPRNQRGRVLAWLLLAALTLVFLVFAKDVAERARVPFDAALLTWLHQHAASHLTALARGLSTVGEPTVIAPLTLLLTLVLLIRRHYGKAALFAVEVGGAAALDLVLKRLFARPRPTLFPHLVPETNFSFPSGHAVGDVAFFLALALVLRGTLPGRWSWLGAVGLVLALLIGASRPYLQVHYPSDILAGWALGAAWVLLVQLTLAPRLRRRERPAAPG